MTPGAWRVPADVLDEWLRSNAYMNLAAVRHREGRRALERLNTLRRRILEARAGELLPQGYGVELIREERIAATANGQ